MDSIVINTSFIFCIPCKEVLLTSEELNCDNSKQASASKKGQTACSDLKRQLKQTHLVAVINGNCKCSDLSEFNGFTGKYSAKMLRMLT
jgi:hypothetical protein